MEEDDDDDDSCLILIRKTLILSTYFEQYTNIKLRENLSIGNRFVPYSQTDGHVEANNPFPQFCERA